MNLVVGKRYRFFDTCSGFKAPNREARDGILQNVDYNGFAYLIDSTGDTWKLPAGHLMPMGGKPQWRKK